MSATAVVSLIEEVSKQTTKLSITVDVRDRVAGGYSGTFIEAIPKTTGERYQSHGIELLSVNGLAKSRSMSMTQQR
jgi:hypothetical protein